jgi:hypothetical protein
MTTTRHQFKGGLRYVLGLRGDGLGFRWQDVRNGVFITHPNDPSSTFYHATEHSHNDWNWDDNLRAWDLFNNRQASKFSAVKSFQIDMTFKRIAGEINEVAIATMDVTLGSSIYHRPIVTLYNVILIVLRRYGTSDSRIGGAHP